MTEIFIARSLRRCRVSSCPVQLNLWYRRIGALLVRTQRAGTVLEPRSTRKNKELSRGDNPDPGKGSKISLTSTVRLDNEANSSAGPLGLEPCACQRSKFNSQHHHRVAQIHNSIGASLGNAGARLSGVISDR